MQASPPRQAPPGPRVVLSFRTLGGSTHAKHPVEVFVAREWRVARRAEQRDVYRQLLRSRVCVASTLAELSCDACGCPFALSLPPGASLAAAAAAPAPGDVASEMYRLLAHVRCCHVAHQELVLVSSVCGVTVISPVFSLLQRSSRARTRHAAPAAASAGSAVAVRSGEAPVAAAQQQWQQQREAEGESVGSMSLLVLSVPSRRLTVIVRIVRSRNVEPDYVTWHLARYQEEARRQIEGFVNYKYRHLDNNGTVVMTSAYLNCEGVIKADLLCARMLFNHGIIDRVDILTNVPTHF
eukprot:m51a1_g5319 hypothetical protein (296) ;mRNA; f:321789-323210